MNRIASNSNVKSWNRLSIRIVVLVILCSSLLTLLTSAFQLYFKYKKDVKSIYANISFIEESYLPAIISSVYSIDMEQTKVLLEGTLNIVDIEYIEIEDTSKNIMISAGNPTASRDVIKAFPLDYTTTSGKKISLGTLKVSGSFEGIYERFWETMYLSLFSNMLRMFVAALIFMVIINSVIVKHLKKVSDFTQNLNLDELEQELILDRKASGFSKYDELDQLVYSLNNMRSRIRNDILMLQQAAEELRQSERIVSTSTDMLALINKEFTYLAVNDAYAKEFNKAYNEIVEHTVSEVFGEEFFNNVIKDKATRCMNGEIINFQDWFDFQFSGRCFIDITFYPYYNAENEITGFVVNGRDITERKKNEKEIETKSIELETQLEKSEKQRVANLVILKDLNKTTKSLTLEIREREKAEAQVKRDLLEKKTLLQELYHRTKNNMQVISSMMSMEARRSDSELLKASFKEITSKINTMALVHQKLYQAKDLSQINLKEYIQDLIRLISRSYSFQASKVSIQYYLEDIYALIDTVMPLGLVLNELITNVFKHAFPESRTGILNISLKLDSNNQINLTLSDNGVGIPGDMDLRQNDSMGLQTMFSLIEHQMQGSVNYISQDGLTWNIKLKESQNKARV